MDAERTESEWREQRTDGEWRERLTNEQYRVLRKGDTERPFTGRLLRNKETGTYVCAGCGAELFSSDAKFDSGTGWPSFTEPAVAANVELLDDFSMFMHRTEVVCRRCGGHLGHVFADGPAPTGMRYCINSLALEFDAAEVADAAESADSPKVASSAEDADPPEPTAQAEGPAAAR